MSFGDRVWETFETVIQMTDKIAALAETVRSQQSKIENLSERMIRLETAFGIMAHRKGGLPRLPDNSG